MILLFDLVCILCNATCVCKKEIGVVLISLSRMGVLESSFFRRNTDSLLHFYANFAYTLNSNDCDSREIHQNQFVVSSILQIGCVAHQQLESEIESERERKRERQRSTSNQIKINLGRQMSNRLYLITQMKRITIRLGDDQTVTLRNCSKLEQLELLTNFVDQEMSC